MHLICVQMSWFSVCLHWLASACHDRLLKSIPPLASTADRRLLSHTTVAANALRCTMLLASPTKCDCQSWGLALSLSQDISAELKCVLLLRDSCVLVFKLPLRLQLWVQSHKQSLQRKLQERHVELQSKQEQLGSVLQESDALRAVIAGQTVNKDDVVRMNQEKWAPCPSLCMFRHLFD